MRKIVVFDFDGTVILGDQPYYRCAEIISKQIHSSDAEAFLSRVNAALTHTIPFPGEDGWNLLSNLSREYISSDAFTSAFHETRKEMLENDGMTYMPDSVKLLLRRIKPYAVLALASNSPPPYVEPVVRKYSLDSYFSYVRPSAQKPAGFQHMVMQIIDHEKLHEDCRVLSVGDHYINDILPAVESGWDGAFVNPFRLDPRKSTVSAENIGALSDWIIDWVHK
ncbi:MAG: HAD family hydrolase [Thermoplasmata archaeon]